MISSYLKDINVLSNINNILLNNLPRKQLTDKLDITEQMLVSIENNKRGKISD